MDAYKERSDRRDGDGDGDCHLRKEIEADVLELWLGVSRLMSRLREPAATRKSARRHQARTQKLGRP